MLAIGCRRASQIRRRLPRRPATRRREAGDLTLIPRDPIEEKLRDLCGRFHLQEIAFDPKCVAKMMVRLVEDGLPAVERQQRPIIMGPFYSESQKAIIGRRFRHGGHPKRFR